MLLKLGLLKLKQPSHKGELIRINRQGIYKIKKTVYTNKKSKSKHKIYKLKWNVGKKAWLIKPSHMQKKKKIKQTRNLKKKVSEGKIIQVWLAK